jgi:anti-sigma factor RsiW
MSSHRFRGVLVAAVVAVVGAGAGGSQALAVPDDATVLKEATRSVDRVWERSKVDEHADVSVKIQRRAGGGATLVDRSGRRLGVSVAGARPSAPFHTAGGTTPPSSAPRRVCGCCR